MKLLLLIAFLILPVGCALTPHPLDAELHRLGTDTALVFPSQEIDEHPVWSPDSKSLAFNAAGAWYKMDMRDMPLAQATWRGDQPIGVIASLDGAKPMDADQANAWLRQSNWGPRKVWRSDGTSIELRASGLGVSLIVTRPGCAPQTIWTSDLENCHSPCQSPDEKYVAYIAELNGVCVMEMDRKPPQ